MRDGGLFNSFIVICKPKNLYASVRDNNFEIEKIIQTIEL